MNNEILLSNIKYRKFNLDPRTKILLLLILNFTIFSGCPWYFMFFMASIPFVILILNGEIKKAFIYMALYVISAFADEILVPLTSGIFNIFVVMISGMVYRIMPGMVMAYYLVSTTTVSEFVASMEKMSLSRNIIIPMSVMFRFFPTIIEEASSIRNAMKLRGIKFGGRKFNKNPLSMIEYRLIPLMASTVKIGEELSAASLTRGLGNPVKRTNICKVGFKVWDFAFIIFGAIGFWGFMVK